MCGMKGLRVQSSTVEYLSLESLEDCKYIQEVFSLCLDPGCEMAYYSADYGYLVFQSHLKVELDHKDDVSKKYICYCHKIEYKTLRKKVETQGLRNAKDLFLNHQKIIVENCKVENPFNCCCIPDIQKKIEEYLKEMQMS